jgi:hypothetical protein
MVRKAVFLTSGEYSSYQVYGVIIGEELTERALNPLWERAQNTAARISREEHEKRGSECERDGSLPHDWEIFVALAFDNGLEVHLLEPSKAAPDIPVGEMFELI